MRTPALAVALAILAAGCPGPTPPPSSPVPIQAAPELSPWPEPELESEDTQPLPDEVEAPSDPYGLDVYVTPQGERFHTTTCRYAKRGRTLTLAEAEAMGRTHCKVCGS